MNNQHDKNERKLSPFGMIEEPRPLNDETKAKSCKTERVTVLSDSYNAPE